MSHILTDGVPSGNLLTQLKEETSLTKKARLRKEYKALPMRERAVLKKEHKLYRVEKKEKRGIWNVTYNGKAKSEIRDIDGESIRYEKGNGKYGAVHIQKHIKDGSFGELSKEELLKMGEIIRDGELSISYGKNVYTLTENKVSFRVVVGIDKRDKKRIITFYSNRKEEGYATKGGVSSITNNLSNSPSITDEEEKVNNKTLIYALEDIKAALEANTIEALEGVKDDIVLIEKNESQIEADPLYIEVISLFNERLGVTMDSIGSLFDSGDLFDEVEADSVDFSNGKYVKREVKNTKELKAWIEAQGITPLDDYHVTIAYSSKDFKHNPIGTDLVIPASDIVGTAILGKEKVQVLEVKSKHLQARHKATLRQGAVFDYDSKLYLCFYNYMVYV